MRHLSKWLGCGLLLSACHAEPAELPKAPLRPVLTTVVHAQTLGAAAFVGRIEPRYATQLGFRVGGRIVRRMVSVGDRVQRGAEIAALDAEALTFAVKSAEAQLEAVRARSTNARTNHERTTKLTETHAVAQSKVDESQAALDAALAAMAEAEARLSKAREDATYAVLRAEFSGVITKIDAEAGQAVAPNTVIAEMARLDALDVVVDVPEAVASRVQLGMPFSAIVESNHSVSAAGKVRQIGPVADATTRTRRLWIALSTPPNELRLGTTVLTTAVGTTSTQLQLPTQAVVEQDGGAAVWVVDGDHVSLREVTLAERSAETLTIAHGLHDGERVVVAGVHSLENGQRIKTSDEAQP